MSKRRGESVHPGSEPEPEVESVPVDPYPEPPPLPEPIPEPPAALELTPPAPLTLNTPVQPFELSQAPPSIRKMLAADPMMTPAGPTAYRCFNCNDERGMPGLMFEAAVPVCPTCNLDARIPRFASYIMPVQLIHFDPPHPKIARMYANTAACDPSNDLRTTGARSSGEILAVTCPKCLLSELGRIALGGRPAPRVPPAADFTISKPEK